MMANSAKCEVHHYHLPTKEHTVDYYEAEISCLRLRKGHSGVRAPHIALRPFTDF